MLGGSVSYSSHPSEPVLYPEGNATGLEARCACGGDTVNSFLAAEAPPSSAALRALPPKAGEDAGAPPVGEAGFLGYVPRRRMRKYLQVVSIGIQNTLVYRVNFLFRVLFGFIPLLAILSMWRVVYAGKGEAVAGYTLAEMTSYYLLITIVDALTAVNEDDWYIAADIKDGNISQFLLKPIDYMTYRLCLFGAGRIVYTSVAAGPVALMLWFYRDYVVLPPDWSTFALFLVSVVMTALLQFFISYTMAMLAFWVLEVSTFIFIVFAFEYIAGGHLFPLDILPPRLFQLLNLTPFPYQLFFPAHVYLGRVTGADLYRGLAVQAAWLIAALVLARFTWHRGVRRYSAVGG